MSTTHQRILLFFLAAILVPIGTIAVILFARGFRPDFQKRTLNSTGLLTAASTPDGAQIYIDGKLVSATNATINLPAKDYLVEIKRVGFQPWKKKLKLEAELVTKARALLFPSVPTLKAVSITGASHIIPSSDGSKVLFLNQSDLYILDLSESPLGLLNRDPKLLISLSEPLPILSWTPDSRQILASASGSASLIDLASQQSIDVTDKLVDLQKEWLTKAKIHQDQKLALLPETLRQILASAAGDLIWSPQENRVLYTATASAVIPDKLIPPLPGSNSQTQSRDLKPNRSYVYDLEEDKNFEINFKNLQWFPDSAHLISTNKDKITILEYDNTNPTVVYTGLLDEGFVFPYPSGKQLLILTNLSPNSKQPPNLYAVSLK